MMLDKDPLIHDLVSALFLAMKYYPVPIGKGVYSQQMGLEKAYIENVRNSVPKKYYIHEITKGEKQSVKERIN